MWLFRRKRKDELPPAEAYGSAMPPQQPDMSSYGGVPNFEPQAPIHPSQTGGFQGFAHQYAGTPPEAKRKPKRRFSWKFRLFFLMPMALSGLAAVMFAGLLTYYTMVFPNPLKLQHKERAPVIRILAQDGSVLAQRGAAHDYMPLIMLPRHVVNAVVATEDRRFFQHWGFDPAGLLRAAFANLRAGRFVQGGSTLTQQLAKNLFLSRERTLTRKLEELALATWLEVRLTKEDILELYLNRVYFGGGAYGIEAAAQRYYDKSARALSIAEAAVIAGLLKAPSRFSPAASPTAARRRGRSVLAKMLRANVITQAQYKRAMKQPVRFAKRKASHKRSAAAYAVDYVLARMPSLITGNHREIVVETTLDADLQKTATKTVQRYLAKKGKALRANQAALVLMDANGAIRAMVGGRSYAKSQFNRAVKARRQPGSSFKPFVYLSALESGLTPDSTAYDLPIKIKGWAPRNGNGTYQGAVSLRYALAKSINTVAVRLNMDLGPGRVADTARRLGITSDLREDPSLALGTSEVNLLELTGAYTVFANGGYAVEPHTIRRVRTNTGRVLYARAGGEPREVIKPEHVGAINDMLNAALVIGTGRRAGIPRHPAAGKTGTSQQFRDAWFVGYSAHMTAGVWLGNDNGRTMDKVMGGTLPAEIWRKVMMAAHKDKAPLALPGTLRASTRVSSSARRIKDLAKPSRRAAIAVRQKPKREVLPWQVRQRAPVRFESVPKKKRTYNVPRVNQSAQSSASARRQVRKPRKAKQAKNQRRRYSNPTQRISEDFFARALSDMPKKGNGPSKIVRRPKRTQPSNGQKNKRKTQPKLVRQPRSFDAAEIEAILNAPEAGTPSARRPRGMMTLGAGQQ